MKRQERHKERRLATISAIVAIVLGILQSLEVVLRLIEQLIDIVQKF
ncbi:hypothetical protein ACY2DA_13435 [Staphylococcus simulans]|nr:hypothetical protein [Staphylococcus aureus]